MARRYLFRLTTTRALHYDLRFPWRNRLRGLRQLVTIGAASKCETFASVAQRAGVPTWRFSDGNISWHILRKRKRNLKRKGG